MKNYTTKELGIHINDIYPRIKRLTKNDGVYKKLSVHFDTNTPQNSDGLYCYSDREGYHFCYIERGNVSMHYITKDLFEITYKVISSSIFSMAFEYEKKHRVEKVDSRRLGFQKEIQYFTELGEDYRKQAEFDINEILKKHPYDDNLSK